MKVTILITAFLAVAIGAGDASAADDDWIGLYIGIDALDGSVDHLSIVPNGDGSYGIRMTSSALAMCTPAPTAGWIVATGRLVDGNLVREDVVYGCAGSDEMTPLGDGIYHRNEETGILTIENHFPWSLP